MIAFQLDQLIKIAHSIHVVMTEDIIIWHRDYNHAHKHNLELLPAENAVFAIFALLNGRPVNCRYASDTANLRARIQELFENPADAGLKNFMHGPWIKSLCFQKTQALTEGEKSSVLNQWIQEYKPAVDKTGDYPGYYGDF